VILFQAYLRAGFEMGDDRKHCADQIIRVERVR
jgi:hypothetical protein